MKKLLMILSSISLFAGCTTFKPDYVITDASETSKPAWIKQSKAHKIDSSSEAKENKYYVNDAENVNQRLCLKSAETRATQKIAAEISQEIMSKYEEKTTSENDVANQKIKDNLEQNIQVNLHGVVVGEKYWEKRAYKKEMGAEKDYIAYKCDVAVKIKKTQLAEALEAYKAKTLRDLKGEEKKAMESAVNEYVEELKE